MELQATIKSHHHENRATTDIFHGIILNNIVVMQIKPAHCKAFRRNKKV
jgi:hypothetical protein